MKIEFFIFLCELSLILWVVKNEKVTYRNLKENFFFLFFLFTLPNLGLTPPGTYKPNARGSDACRGSNSLWTRTLDRYTSSGLPQCVLSTMSGSPPKTTQDRTQTKDTHPIPRQKLKFLTPPELNPGRRAGRQGLYRPRHGDELKKNSRYQNERD